jgi:hypothetical protein
LTCHPVGRKGEGRSITAYADRIAMESHADRGRHAAEGVPPENLDDDTLRREMGHLHATRHDTVLDGSEDALETHTRRMLALEKEFLRRFPAEGAPKPARTRAGSRAEAGQPEAAPRSPEARA